MFQPFAMDTTSGSPKTACAEKRVSEDYKKWKRADMIRNRSNKSSQSALLLVSVVSKKQRQLIIDYMV